MLPMLVAVDRTREPPGWLWRAVTCTVVREVSSPKGLVVPTSLTPHPTAQAVVRPLTAAALAAVPSWAHELADLRPDRWRDDTTRAVLVFADEQDTEPIGLGRIWTSRVHPSHYWFEVVIAPDHRGRGWGRWLVGQLRELRVTPTPMRCRGFVGTTAWGFGRALGATTVQVVPPVRIDLGQRELLPRDERVVGADQVTGEQVCRAWAELYEWTHRGWSEVGEGFAAALTEDLLEELDLAASSVALDAHGQIAAMALVFDDDPVTICAETTAPDTAQGEHLVGACLARSLDLLAGRDAVVEFDGHVSDPHFLPHWVALSPSGPWFTLMDLA